MLAFALFGALLVLVGANLGALRASLDLDLADSGLLVSSVLCGIGLGVIVGGPLADRLPRRLLFSVALVVSGAALCGLDSGQAYWTIFALLFLAGVGGGLYETVLNAVAIERYAERSVRMVAIMHSAASVGALLTPLGISLLVCRQGPADWALGFEITGVCHWILAALALATPLGAPRVASKRLGPAGKPRVLTPSLALLCVAAFGYVGIESAITGLALPYAEGALGLPADRGRSAISLFWLGLLGGRLLFALRAGSIDDARFAAASGGLAGIAIAAGVVLAWSQIELLFAGLGFVLGGVFPLLVALAGRRTPTATASGVALVAGLGSAGGFVAPWLTGVIGDAIGMTTAMGSLALWCGVITIAAILADRLRSGVRR